MRADWLLLAFAVFVRVLHRLAARLSGWPSSVVTFTARVLEAVR